MAVRLTQAAAAFCSAAPGESSNNAADVLVKIISAVGSNGKENSAAKQQKATALECLKAAQQKLGEPASDPRRLAAACRSLLHLLEQSGTRSAAAASQLHTARYHTVRRLVSARAFVDALQEALVLYNHLRQWHGGTVAQRALPAGGGAPLSVETANLVVGTTLTLVLCWAEGAAVTSSELSCVLGAAEGAESWLRLLKPEEAAKHRDALFKYLYRGAARLAAEQQWAGLQAACCAMVEAVGAAGAPRALHAAAKLAPHAPVVQAASLLAAVVNSDILAASLKAVEEEPAANLAPQHLEVLVASLQPANALRRLVAPLASAEGSPEALVDSVGGAAAAAAVAQSLDVLASAVALAARASCSTADISTFSHAAAVAVVTAARLRAACERQEAPPQVSTGSHAVGSGSCLPRRCGEDGWGRLLGWRSHRWRSMPSVLKPHELTWLSSSMFNIGVDLHSSGHHAAAAAPFRCALAAALAMAHRATQQGSEVEASEAAAELAARLQDVHKRSAALCETLQQAGQPEAGAAAAADTLRTLLQLQLQQPQQWQPVVTAHVKARLQSITAQNGTKQQAEQGVEHWVGSLLRCGDGSLGGQPVRDGVVQEVALAEVSAWAALAEASPPDAAAAAAHMAAALSAHLLAEAHSAEDDPVGHGRVLLHLHCSTSSAIVSANGGSGDADSYLCRAAAVLRSPAGGGDVEAACLLAHISVVSALGLAQGLVQEALQAEQQRQLQLQERQRPEEAARGAAEIAAPEPAVAAWKHVTQHAQQAAEQCSALAERLRKLKGGGGGGGSDCAGLAEAARQLALMLSLLGHVDIEAELLSAAEGIATGSPAASAGSVEGCAGSLHDCFFGGLADDGRGVAALEREALELATAGDRSLAITLRRARLWMAAAQRRGGEGALVPALHAASESHRLLANAVHAGGAADGASSTGGRWWQLAASYLRSLLLLGELFEASGLADEAVQALKEGQRMAACVGSGLLYAAFSVRLADTWHKQGGLSAAAQSLQAAAAHLEAAPESAGASAAGQCCQAEAAALQARLHLSNASLSEALLACHDALEASQQAAEAAAEPAEAARAAALQAQAQLGRAECLAAQGDAVSGAEQAAAALQALGPLPGSVAALACRARLLLFLAGTAQALSAPEPPLQHARVWGVGSIGVVGFAGLDGKPAKERSGKAPSKNAGRSRTRGRAAAAAAGGDEAPGEGSDAAIPPASSTAEVGSAAGWRELWAAYAISGDMPHLHRLAAARLAAMCGARGHLHLAAALLHSSMGATMQLQHRLVLHTRRAAAAQRQPQGAGGPSERAAADAMHALHAGLEPALVHRLAGHLSAAAPAAGKQPKAGRKAAAPAQASGDEEAAAALAALEAQAELLLTRWLAALPAGVPVCSVGVHPCALSACLSPAFDGEQYLDRIVVSRMQMGQVPLVVELPVAALQSGSGFSQHPIRALSMDVSGGCAAGDAVQSALDEMQRVLERSAHSMHDLGTDTREQQREWWRARVDLDDALAGLVGHLDATWLGAWRCLLMGAPPSDGGGDAGHAAHAERVVARLQGLGGGAGATAPAVPRQVSVALQLVRAVTHARAALTTCEMQQAAGAVCSALGLDSQGGGSLLAAATAILGEGPAPSPAAPRAPLAAASALKPAAGRRVKFQEATADDSAAVDAARGDAAAMDVSPAPTLRRATCGDADPPSCLPGNLCDAFDALALDGGTLGAAPTSTVRAKKHKSRLALMQASTPAPKSARRPLAAAGGAATAPRAPRPLPKTPAPKTVPAGARPAATPSGPAGGPVVVVFDGLLQALPWESAPGLAGQQLYRIPSLACAAAGQVSRRQAAFGATGESEGRRHGSCSAAGGGRGPELAPHSGAAALVDLSSAFYALNPSGDLVTTQSTFQDWFQRLEGWEGRAGAAPEAAELAAALQSRELFVYFGHGGGEQYIPPARLRALPRCSSALLMGCSSGRLRGRRLYEPAGVVLAYLLAGCPAAVANLWDVTDKDIDRFSQAVLTQWLSGGGGAGGGGDFAAAVAAGRGACKLPHLIGAAPVCYGVPTAARLPQRL